MSNDILNGEPFFTSCSAPGEIINNGIADKENGAGIKYRITELGKEQIDKIGIPEYSQLLKIINEVPINIYTLRTEAEKTEHVFNDIIYFNGCLKCLINKELIIDNAQKPISDFY